MAQPDLVDFGAEPGRRRPWGWLAAVVLVLAFAVSAVALGNRNGSHPTPQPSPSATGGAVSTVVVYGFGYQTSDDVQAFWLDVHNVGTVPVLLSRPAVAATRGVTPVATGFRAGKDPDAPLTPTLTLLPDNAAQVTVQYRVDCAAVTAPWPYLGEFTVAMTSGTTSDVQGLESPDTAAGVPSPLPCALAS